jgi:hypothetical protein
LNVILVSRARLGALADAIFTVEPLAPIPEKVQLHEKNFVNFSFELVTKGHFLTEIVAISLEITFTMSLDSHLSTLQIIRKFTAPLIVMKIYPELRTPQKLGKKAQTGCVRLANDI